MACRIFKKEKKKQMSNFPFTDGPGAMSHDVASSVHTHTHAALHVPKDRLARARVRVPRPINEPVVVVSPLRCVCFYGRCLSDGRLNGGIKYRVRTRSLKGQSPQNETCRRRLIRDEHSRDSRQFRRVFTGLRRCDNCKITFFFFTLWCPP